MNRYLEIILIGTGFYVCGKEKETYGTILPAILTFAKLNTFKVKIVVGINSKKSEKILMKKFMN